MGLRALAAFALDGQGMHLAREACYFLSAGLFILSLRWLSSAKTARRANVVSMIAMLLAVVPTFVERVGGTSGGALVNNLAIIGGGIALGSVIGLISAYKVKMTAMPQMVGLYNGFGGAASLLVAAVEFLYKTRFGTFDPSHPPTPPSVADSIPIHLSIIIGGICFTGSIAAFAKLQELISGRPVLFRRQHLLNLVLLLGAVGTSVYLTVDPLSAGNLWIFIGLAAACLLLGWLVVIPIGGADMPVVISLMNSYSGMAVTATGFVLNNKVLIIVGSLVGASGLILTQIMCKAMNRSLANVMFGGFGAVQKGPERTGGDKGQVKEASVDEAAEVLGAAGSAIVVPGYGMAVSQAQHAVRDLAHTLEKQGVRVRYAIHPVAGRMPGHMNVLLAEANVPYDQLFDLDQINDDFANTDVVLVVGANDIVNPAAKQTPGSPIYGMPVFNCDQAKSIIVLKRSMNPGFAGIENELFVHPKTMMVFGDAKQTLMNMNASLKSAAASH